MPAFVSAGCPRKLHKHAPEQQPFCLAVTLPSWCSVRLGREMRRARVSTDDLREKQLRGSLPAEEAFSREPRCRLPRRGVCSAHSRGFGTKPAFPGLEIIKRMKSCCPGAAGGKMDGASREGGEERVQRYHTEKEGEKPSPFTNPTRKHHSWGC